MTLSITQHQNFAVAIKGSRSPQTPSAVIMIRPHQFVPNPQTALDNAFQAVGELDPFANAVEAYSEATKVIEKLEACGVRVHVFEDETKETPDSVFPNNWFSTHPGGHVALFPMFTENRRKERRHDIIEMLKRNYRVQDIVDYSGMEPDGLFLEGTGAMVLDHIDRVAYAVKSNRTDPVLLERFCTHFNYEPMVFEAQDQDGVTVYHTNVLMCIATDLVLIGLDMIDNVSRREELVRRFHDTGREVIELSSDQIASFAGNMIELHGINGRVLALSSTAYNSLSVKQVKAIEKKLPLLPLHIPTIEKAGGSVRCMLAGVHLSAR